MRSRVLVKTSLAPPPIIVKKPGELASSLFRSGAGRVRTPMNTSRAASRKSTALDITVMFGPMKETTKPPARSPMSMPTCEVRWMMAVLAT